jgi:Gluconate 2-dehydrogenase subunit 3
MMTPGEARVPGGRSGSSTRTRPRLLEARGEALVPGAKQAGVAHFNDQQVSVPPGEALLEARQLNVRPPFINFYRTAIAAVDEGAEARSGRRFAALGAGEQHDFIDAMRQNKIDGWQGPRSGFVYQVLRNDAVDVVYGTMEGYESLGVPYMPHTAPDRRW